MGIHPTAIIAPGARVHASADIGPFSYLGPLVSIGPGTRLHAHSIVHGRVSIGARNVLESYCVVGGGPQDSGVEPPDSRAVLGDDNVLGRGVTVNRGTLKGGGVTSIGSRNRFEEGAHVAHDCTIGDDCLVGVNVLLAGHIRMESGARVDSRVGVHHWVTIGAHSRARVATPVNQDLPPYMVVAGLETKVVGVNEDALKALGMSERSIAGLAGAIPILWRAGLPKPDALKRVLLEFGDVVEVRTLVEFLRASDLGFMGRRQERSRLKAAQ